MFTHGCGKENGQMVKNLMETILCSDLCVSVTGNITDHSVSFRPLRMKVCVLGSYAGAYAHPIHQNFNLGLDRVSLPLYAVKKQGFNCKNTNMPVTVLIAK